MKKIPAELALCIALILVLNGCEKVRGESESGDTGPVDVVVEPDTRADSFKVSNPDRFQLATASEHRSAPELHVTGVVSPDVSRQVPVPSLTSGRVLEIDARLGDQVKKGQILFKVRSSDIQSAFSDYDKAVRNEQLAIKSEHLTKIQLDRAQLLYDKGATSKSSLEIAVNAEEASKTDLENKRVDVATTRERVEHLGGDADHPSDIVVVRAPVSGVITDQQITDSSGIQALTPPNPFTISDLSRVWIVCDVYESDIGKIQLGEYADIRLNAYPDRTLKARISNIPPMLDPNIRTSKVRLEVENPGILRFGMFVVAAFHGQQEVHAAVPSTAVLHLHDREWIYMPAGNGSFRRIEVTAGNMLPGDMQEIIAGIKPGDQVIANALVLQDTVEK
jgi:cobalt-zinc-cadmium efflux system membrane fusion protein